jgi:hypothetical protein
MKISTTVQRLLQTLERSFWVAVAMACITWPASSSAQIGAVPGIIASIGGTLTGNPGSGGCGGPGAGFLGIALAIYSAFAPVFWIVSALIIIIFGMRMIVGQEDDILDKSRPVMTAVIGGLIIVNLVLPLLSGLYGCRGENLVGGGAASFLTAEALGFIDWALVLAAPLAVFIIVLTALRAMLNPTDDSIGLLKRCLGAVVVGMILLVFRLFIGERTATNADPIGGLVETAIKVLNFILQFMALAAVIMVVYAGIRLILSLGNSDALAQSRQLLFRVVIGAVLILFAYIIIAFVANPIS